MSQFIQLIITIFETIKEWLVRKDDKKKERLEKVEKAEEKLQDVVNNGSLAGLQNIANELKKANS